MVSEAVHNDSVQRRFRHGVVWFAVEPRADVLRLQSDLARRLSPGGLSFAMQAKDATCWPSF